MAVALNLRTDLAKLGDAELAERLSVAWARYDAAPKSKWLLRPAFPLGGPIRHSRVYRFLMAASAINPGHWIEWLLPLVFSSKLTDSLVEGTNDPELVLCEIKDLTDEIERRVKRRKGKSGRGS